MKNSIEEAKKIVCAFYNGERIERATVPTVLIPVGTPDEELIWQENKNGSFNFQERRYRIAPKEQPAREFWIVNNQAFRSPMEATKIAIKTGTASIHVREVKK